MPGEQSDGVARGNGAATAILALADGTIFRGRGFGATGAVSGELCFNTAMTGYQEILSDPASANQIVTFTFPHIGNTGTNREDDESPAPSATGMVLRADVTEPSNWRATEHLSEWLRRHGRIGISGIDTRPEEHTSQLQSRGRRLCRLRLDKQNGTRIRPDAA